MDRFAKFHPKGILLFFVCEIIATLFYFHPLYLTVSLLGALAYRARLNTSTAVKTLFTLVLPLAALTAVFNMLFAHYGMTVLFAVGNSSFTLESLFYGFTQGLLIGAVLLWFACYHAVVSGEMLLAVFGRVTPQLSLLFSMTLTFLPRLRRNASEINDAQSLLTPEDSRLQRSIRRLSSLVMMTLEESIEVADSMKARGYHAKRTAYSKFRFSMRDAVLCLITAVLFFLILGIKISSGDPFIFEPEIHLAAPSPLLLTATALLAFTPTIVDVTEDIKWHFLRQNI